MHHPVTRRPEWAVICAALLILIHALAAHAESEIALTHPSPSPPVAPSAVGKSPKHPILVGNSRGEVLLVWTEGTGWAKGGDVAWQRFDWLGKPIGARGHVTGLPAWSMAAAAAPPADGFVIVY
jgi:hypothetical protein